MTVFVEAAARLHFGVLDLRGARGRRFGGIGAAAPAPTLLVSAQRAEALDVQGEDGDRAGEFARRFLMHARVGDGVRLQVHRALPAHAGLGSGTQLALAVARAIADLYDIRGDAPTLAAAVGRGRRSAVGTWIFAGGGLVVEGGHASSLGPSGSGDPNPGVAPLVARLAFPEFWRCVVAVPDCAPAISGAAEDVALNTLPAPRESGVERVAELVRTALLPAVALADLVTFGEALTEIQRINGEWFAPVQGGVFAPGPSAHLVRCMASWGIPGMGQSSWGPAVYGIVEGADAAAALAMRLRSELGRRGSVYEGPFRTTGARVWREDV